jgi:predicted TIM-barrel fold metal-dependent hydrolase
MSAEQAAIREADLRLAELYRDFLPEKVFDAHVHLYLDEAIPRFRGTDGVFFRGTATVEHYLSDMLPLLPGVSQVRMQAMPFPDTVLNDTENGLRAKANGHILEQLRLHPEHVGACYVLASDDVQTIGDMVSKPGIRAIKPYYFSAANANGNTGIDEFLPQAAWEVSQETGIPIVLHMMRAKSLADADNFAYVQAMTEKYPNAPLVLAHCARGFAAWTAVMAIPKLADRENIWFDMSSVCEVGPIMAAIQKTGGKRIMWGSDWPVCLNRGRALSMADGQLWLTETPGTHSSYALVAAESLFALYQTALLMNLDQTQIHDIFYRNAAALFRTE